MKLYLIRHAESANNAAYGQSGGEEGRVPDPEITEVGHRQSALLGEHLAHPHAEPRQHPFAKPELEARSFGLTHLYCSLMTRSILTARYIAEACELAPVAHPGIFEKGGIYELADDGSKVGLPGRDRRYFSERFPEVELPSDLRDDGWYNRPAETEEGFASRTRDALRDIRERHRNTEDRVAMVVHGDFIDQFVNELLRTRRRAENYRHGWEASWVTHNTSITRVDFGHGSQVVVYTNRLDHLPSELVTW